MAKLTGVIVEQNFEKIRNRIGEILADEIANQFSLRPTETEIDAKVFVERFTPFDKSEFPAVNVLLSSAEYNPITSVQDNGMYEFFIDVYTTGKNTGGVRGDSVSAQNLHKLLGICRSILRSPYYLTLGFQVPQIGHISIPSIQVMEPKNNQDATNAIWGRLVFKVLAPETSELQVAVDIDSWKTQVKLNLTEKGYLYEIN